MSMNDSKYDDDDDYNECVLEKGNDRRRSIRDSPNKLDTIIECVVSIKSEYTPDKKLQQHEFSHGTGTIIHANEQNIYILTAAHNIIAVQKECKCGTKTLKENCVNKNCMSSNPTTYKTQNKIKAEKILFSLRDQSGVCIETHQIDDFKFPDEYYEFPTASGGYDIAILIFKCNKKKTIDSYREKCSKFSLVNDDYFGGTKSLMHIYGYPYEKMEKKNEGTYYYLWGMATSKLDETNKFRVVKNKNTNKLYIENRGIDTTAGQSGSCIYSYNGEDTSRYLIYGVHTGGSQKKTTNYGTFFDIDNIEWIANILDVKNEISTKLPKFITCRSALARSQELEKKTILLQKELEQHKCPSFTSILIFIISVIVVSIMCGVKYNWFERTITQNETCDEKMYNEMMYGDLNDTCKMNMTQINDTWYMQYISLIDDYEKLNVTKKKCDDNITSLEKRLTETIEDNQQLNTKITLLRENTADESWSWKDLYNFLPRRPSLKKKQSEEKNLFCVGQLYIEYGYPQNNYTLSISGTGTVFTSKTNDKSSATAFVLSAAHIVKRNVWQCCGQYVENANNCSKCEQCGQYVMINATKIQFQRNVGNIEEGYECKVEYLDEYNYKAFPYLKSGFDWVLLSFVDEENYYLNNCKKIELVAMETTDIFKDKQFMTVGYSSGTTQMVGYKMNQNAMTMKSFSDTNRKNIYLQINEMNAFGAAIVIYVTDQLVICGIYVGVNDEDKDDKYDVGILLNKDIIEHINCIINGTQKWVNREKWNDGESYFGFVKNGKQHGYGKTVWKSGSDYEGSMKNGNKHGYGKYVWESGDIYEGNWQNNHINGHGKIVYSDGSTYEGEWKDGNKHGYGKYKWKDGDVYEGEWENKKRNGYGKITYIDGSTYEGEWKDSNKHGYGKEVWKSGAIYEGNYANDQTNGYGKYTWKNGDVYEGEWENNKRNGYGKKTYIDGSTYEGEWKNSKRHGNGKQTKKER